MYSQNLHWRAHKIRWRVKNPL